jgi:GTP-binding protein Era
MNKIDTVPKNEVAGYMEMYRKLYPFEEIIPVSALRNVNTESVLEAVFSHLPEGPMYYDGETVTDQTMRTLASEIIREKALRCLKEEVPHGIAVEIMSMKERRRKTEEVCLQTELIVTPPPLLSLFEAEPPQEGAWI